MINKYKNDPQYNLYTVQVQRKSHKQAWRVHCRAVARVLKRGGSTKYFLSAPRDPVAYLEDFKFCKFEGGSWSSFPANFEEGGSRCSSVNLRWGGGVVGALFQPISRWGVSDMHAGSEKEP